MHFDIDKLFTIINLLHETFCLDIRSPAKTPHNVSIA